MVLDPSERPDGGPAWLLSQPGVLRAAWEGEPWKTLGFALDEAHYYQYRVTRDGGGFVVEARGDLDCDGVFGRFSRQVTPDGVSPLQSEKEIE